MIALKPGALSRCCSELGLSREALSRRMGVSPTTLYRLDRGDSTPSARLIALLIRATGRPFEALFDVGPEETAHVETAHVETAQIDTGGAETGRATDQYGADQAAPSPSTACTDQPDVGEH